MIQISIVNRSTLFKDADMAPLVAALQVQASRDLPLGGWPEAKLNLVAPGENPAPGASVISLLDDADQASVLGYHDVTPDGYPLGKVFVRATLAENSAVSVTVSHELCEMLGDPDINLVAERDDAQGRAKMFYAFENCDACEADQFAYDIDGVKVSDFVYRSWFQQFRRQGSVQFDFAKKITAPFQLLSGGYIGVLDLKKGMGWTQLTADASKTTRLLSRAKVGSRRERRRTTRDLWVASDYVPRKV